MHGEILGTVRSKPLNGNEISLFTGTPGCVSLKLSSPFAAGEKSPASPRERKFVSFPRRPLRSRICSFAIAVRNVLLACSRRNPVVSGASFLLKGGRFEAEHQVELMWAEFRNGAMKRGPSLAIPSRTIEDRAIS